MSTTATVLGCLLLLLGGLAGIVNRQVLDGPRFAEHVDAVRSDPAVARLVGQRITDRVLELEPDLVAVRPLIEAVATSLAGSELLGPAVRAGATRLHTAFTGTGSEPVVLRLADVGAVLTATLRALSPGRDTVLPEDFDVTLAKFGSGSFATESIALTQWVGLLSWLLPLLALLLLAFAVWVARDRPTAGVRAGVGVAATGLGIGLLAVVATALAASADPESLTQVSLAAFWDELAPSVWWLCAAFVAAGAVLAGASSQLRTQDLRHAGAQAWTSLAHGGTTGWVLARGLGLALLGLALLRNPALVLRVTAALAGLGLLFVAAVVLARVPAPRASPRERLRRFRPRLALMWLLPVLLVTGLVVRNAAPADSAIPIVASNTRACNGHVALCDRRYDDVAYPATHNSMSAADEPRWFLPEQPTSLVGQLDSGVRVLLIDTWYGQPTQRAGVVVTAAKDRDSALAQAEADYSPDVVAAALRVRQSANLTPTGPPEPYLCHAMCELGSTKLEPAMKGVEEWMAAHPREVVTLFIQDEVSPADTAAVLEQAGLTAYAHTQLPGQRWPTLREMVTSGKRLVVLMENEGGGATYPWLLQGFDWVQDTPYENASASSFSCRRLRGTPDSPLLLVNHWLNGYTSLVTDAQTVNAYGVLMPQLERCQSERGMIPNFVAVNFYDRGNLFAAVDTLNGFG